MILRYKKGFHSKAQDEFMDRVKSRLKSKIDNKETLDKIFEEMEPQGKEKVKSVKSEEKSNEEANAYLRKLAEKIINKIPSDMVIKTLYFPTTKSHILLAGVKQPNDVHTSYLYDLMRSLEPDTILTSIPPDSCYLLRTQENYKKTWNTHMKQMLDVKFLTNPNPLYLSEITLDPLKIDVLLNGPINQTPEIFEVGPICIYAKKGLKEKAPMHANSYLSPILYSYNNPEKKIPIILMSYPILKYRDYIVNTVPLQKLKMIFEEQIVNLRKKDENFDFRLLYRENFLQPVISYMIEIIKQSCYTGKKILVVVDWSMVDIINDEWISLNPKIQSLQKYLQQGELQETDESYLEYIEKHVILDLMMDEYIKEYFVDLGSFPFGGLNTFGREVTASNTMTIWNHSYTNYTKRIKSIEQATGTYEV